MADELAAADVSKRRFGSRAVAPCTRLCPSGGASLPWLRTTAAGVRIPTRNMASESHEMLVKPAADQDTRTKKSD